MPHLKSAETQRVRKLVDEYGVAAAAKKLPIHHSVLTRVLAGIPVRPSSISKLRAGLAKSASSALESPQP